MARHPVSTPPPGAAVSTVSHRVPFYETDAMGIVHHANFVHYLELARVHWLDEHDRPYREIAASGIHYATTRVDLAYRRSARFDDVIEVSTWLEWVRGASLRMAYHLRCADAEIAVGATEHAAVDLDGRVRRLPRESLENYRKLALERRP